MNNEYQQSSKFKIQTHKSKQKVSNSLGNRTEETKLCITKLTFNLANLLNTALINIICIQNQHHIKIVLLWQS